MVVASAPVDLLPAGPSSTSARRRRGLVLLGLRPSCLPLTVADWAHLTVDRPLVATLLVMDLALLALRLFAVADVWRGGALGLVVLVALTAAPHVAAG